MTDKPDAKEESDGAFYKRMDEKMLGECAPGLGEVARLVDLLRQRRVHGLNNMYPDADCHEAADFLTRLSLALAKAESELAGAVATEREACAAIFDTVGEKVFVTWDRPGGPPGNGYAPLTGKIVRDLIRARASVEQHAIEALTKGVESNGLNVKIAGTTSAGVKCGVGLHSSLRR